MQYFITQKEVISDPSVANFWGLSVSGKINIEITTNLPMTPLSPKYKHKTVHFMQMFDLKNH